MFRNKTLLGVVKVDWHCENCKRIYPSLAGIKYKSIDDRKLSSADVEGGSLAIATNVTPINTTLKSFQKSLLNFILKTTDDDVS